MPLALTSYTRHLIQSWMTIKKTELAAQHEFLKAIMAMLVKRYTPPIFTHTLELSAYISLCWRFLTVIQDCIVLPIKTRKCKDTLWTSAVSVYMLNDSIW